MGKAAHGQAAPIASPCLYQRFLRIRLFVGSQSHSGRKSPLTPPRPTPPHAAHSPQCHIAAPGHLRGRRPPSPCRRSTALRTRNRSQRPAGQKAALGTERRNSGRAAEQKEPCGRHAGPAEALNLRSERNNNSKRGEKQSAALRHHTRAPRARRRSAQRFRSVTR